MGGFDSKKTVRGRAADSGREKTAIPKLRAPSDAVKQRVSPTNNRCLRADKAPGKSPRFASAARRQEAGTNPLSLRRLLQSAGGGVDSSPAPAAPSFTTAAEFSLRAKYVALGVIFPVIMALDLVTKRWALEALAFERSEILGGLVPLTLAFNRGAAFGISLGDDSRWFFVPVTLLALALLAMLFRQAHDHDRLRIVSISLVVSGAIGNLYDRVRWSRGVIDFIGPIDLGFWDFPIFNVADMAITCGAILLALSFWFEEQEERNRAAAAAPAVPNGEPSA